MLQFEYKAVGSDGKTRSGIVHSVSSESALRELVRRGLTVEELGTGSVPVFIQTINHCLEHRLEMVEAIENCQKESHWLKADKPLSNLLAHLRNSTTADRFVSDARLARFLPFVLLFEEGRDSAVDFRNWIKDYLRQANRKRLVWLILSYPVLMTFIYLSILVALSFTIIPQFQAMYDEFELRLPAATRLLLNVSEQIREHPLRSLLMTVLGAVAVCGLVFTVRETLGELQGSPFWGRFSRSSKKQLLGMSRLTATLAELLRIETPLPEAVRIAGLASCHRYYRRASADAADGLTRDAAPNTIRRISNCFPATLVHALQAGANQQPSIPLIQTLSNIYSQRLEQRIQFAQGFMAPVMTILMAWLIGYIVSALISPLVSLIQSLSG